MYGWWYAGVGMESTGSPDSLLGVVRLDVRSVGAEMIAVGDVADAFTLGQLVLERIPRSFSDRLSFPLAHSGHDVKHQPTGSGVGIE